MVNFFLCQGPFKNGSDVTIIDFKILHKFGHMDIDLAINSSQFGLKVSSGPGKIDIDVLNHA